MYLPDEVENTKDEQQNEEVHDDEERGSHAKIEEIESKFVDEERDETGGVVRSAVGHDEGGRESILQANQEIAETEYEQPG
jgi:hypothetical protein